MATTRVAKCVRWRKRVDAAATPLERLDQVERGDNSSRFLVEGYGARLKPLPEVVFQTGNASLAGSRAFI